MLLIDSPWKGVQTLQSGSCYNNPQDTEEKAIVIKKSQKRQASEKRVKTNAGE